MIKIGIVNAVNGTKARVWFPADRMMSDWLTVVQRGEPWTPEIGTAVICAFAEGFNADGYVLGVTG
jgi:phage baseplate assembly protein gpV